MADLSQARVYFGCVSAGISFTGRVFRGRGATDLAGGRLSRMMAAAVM